MTLVRHLVASYSTAACGLEFLSPLADLALRLWVANVFWKSGLTKIQSMDSTIMLFTYEYQVPLLSPTVPAYKLPGQAFRNLWIHMWVNRVHPCLSVRRVETVTEIASPSVSPLLRPRGADKTSK